MFQTGIREIKNKENSGILEHLGKLKIKQAGTSGKPLNTLFSLESEPNSFHHDSSSPVHRAFINDISSAVDAFRQIHFCLYEITEQLMSMSIQYLWLHITYYPPQLCVVASFAPA